MSNIFKPKRSNTPSSIPTTGQLADGELAVNSADKVIYLRDGGNIVEVANYSTGTGTGESYWIQTAAGIHTLSNVGIGTTNPTSKLTVDGDILVSGVVTANNIPKYYFQSNAPSSPNVGDRWVDDTDGIVYIYYDDGNSKQWIEFGPTPIEYSSSGGTIGIATAGGTVGTGVTLLDFRGAGISTVTVSSGIGTVNIEGGGTATTSTNLGLVVATTYNMLMP